MKSKRPIFLDLSKISLPMPALSSILHRISGLTMVLSFPLVAYLFAQSIESEEGFLWVSTLKEHNLFLAVIIWGLISDVLYHLLSGLRHLFMDLHFFEELSSSRLSAKFLFGIYIVLFALITAWYWG